MRTIPKSAPIGLFLLSTLAIALPGPAQESVPAARPEPAKPKAGSKIVDNAHLFGASAIAQAEAILAKAEEKSRLPVVIETVESLSGEPVDDVALKRARQLGSSGGVFVLISKDDHKISPPLIRRQFEARLPVERRAAIRDAIVSEFKKREFDAGLAAGVSMLAETLTATAPDPSEPPPAADSPAFERNRLRLTLAGARQALAAAETKATELGIKENIAVVDDAGHLLAFSRMDGARPASIATALTKAEAAATTRQTTGPLGGARAGEPDVLLNLSLQNASAGKMTSLLGGIPIFIDGQIVGAVGVGGGTGEQDAEVAKAGVAIFQKEGK